MQFYLKAIRNRQARSHQKTAVEPYSKKIKYIFFLQENIAPEAIIAAVDKSLVILFGGRQNQILI